ncbi:MAG: type IV pilus assembly protein PilM [bacterium]
MQAKKKNRKLPSKNKSDSATIDIDKLNREVYGIDKLDLSLLLSGSKNQETPSSEESLSAPKLEKKDSDEQASHDLKFDINEQALESVNHFAVDEDVVQEKESETVTENVANESEIEKEVVEEPDLVAEIENSAENLGFDFVDDAVDAPLTLPPEPEFNLQTEIPYDLKNADDSETKNSELDDQNLEVETSAAAKDHASTENLEDEDILILPTEPALASKMESTESTEIAPGNSASDLPINLQNQDFDLSENADLIKSSTQGGTEVSMPFPEQTDALSETAALESEKTPVTEGTNELAEEKAHAAAPDLSAANAEEPAVPIPNAADDLASPRVLSEKTATHKRESESESPDEIRQSLERIGASFQSHYKGGSLLNRAFSLTSLFENSKSMGLDIGTNSLKYVVIQRTGNKLKLVDCSMRPNPELMQHDREESKLSPIANTIREDFNLKQYKNTLITSAVSGLEVLYQNIKLPLKAEKELARAVPWACRKDFPFPLESTHFEYKVIDKNRQSNGKIELFVTAAQNDLISKHIDVLQSAAVTPTKVSTVPVALWNLYRVAVSSDGEESIAIIDLGGGSSHVAFINHGELQFAREISTGGNDITEALTGSIFLDGKEVTISHDRAESLKREYGYILKPEDRKTTDGIPLQEISVMMGPVLERLITEIKRTVDFYKEKFHVESLQKILISGGGALLINLPKYLSRELDTPVAFLEPFRNISLKNVTNQTELAKLGSRFAVAIGLALDRERSLNFLPGNLKKEHTFRQFKKIFNYGFLIFLLILLVLSQRVKFQIQKFEKEIAAIRVEYQNYKPKREKYLGLQKQLSALQHLRKQFQGKVVVNLASSNHLKAISNLIPANIALTSLKLVTRYEKSFEHGQELVILDGVAFHDRSREGVNLANFLLALENSHYFDEIAIKYQKIREDGNLEFAIECTI